MPNVSHVLDVVRDWRTTLIVNCDRSCCVVSARASLRRRHPPRTSAETDHASVRPLAGPRSKRNSEALSRGFRSVAIQHSRSRFRSRR